MSATLTTVPSRTVPWWRLAFAFLVLAVALWAVHALVRDVGWRELIARLRSPRWPVLGFAALCLLGHLYLWGYRWKLAIRRVDAAPRRRVIYAALATAASVNLVAPFARVLGGLLRARYLARAGSLSLASFYGVVLFDQIAHLVVMSALTGLALVAGAMLLGETGWAVALGGAVALFVAVFLFWHERLTARGPAWLAHRLAGRRPGRGLGERLLERSRETVDMLARLLADRALRLQATLLGLGIFLLSALAQGAVFHALEVRPHPLVVLVTVALGTAAGTLAGTPGGLGAAEAAMIAVLVALRVDRLDAAAAALLYRALYYAVVLVSGLPAAAYLEWRLAPGLGSARPEPDEESR